MAVQEQGTAELVAQGLARAAQGQGTAEPGTAELVALGQETAVLAVQGQDTAGPVAREQETVAREQETVALGLAEQAARERAEQVVQGQAMAGPVARELGTVALGLAEQAARERAEQVVQGQAMAGPVEQEHNPGPGIDRNYVQHLIQISVHFQHRTLDRGKQSCAGIPEPKTAYSGRNRCP
ncbi:hypothetical protein LPJ67_004797 [Coemansia sp. RSA 1938]|nr:hypothetical protein LPJ67_004797 [Coemansia sp. RSA 1938]